TNGVRRAAIAKTNDGLIENCFIDVSFGNVGQGQNQLYASAGVVMTNNGRINNSLVKFTYTGSAAIETKLLLVCSLNEASGVITNTSAIVYSEKVDAQTFVYQWTNKGTKQNDWIWRSESEAFNNDVNFKWTVKTGQNGYTFATGGVWNYDENGIYFFGSKVIG
ncbi:MAG: hypothetical protein IJS67_03870, partial [Clostridia bacterium]|nr:hypothetical protein [Clostridia bacterium]